MSTEDAGPPPVLDPLDVGLRLSDRPTQNSRSASIDLDGNLLIASDLGASPVLLDPVSAVVWQSLTGEATVAEIAEDLASSLELSRDDSAAHVSWIIGFLSLHALVDWPGCTATILPRRVMLIPDPATCVGQTLGLGPGSRVLQLRGATGDRFRVGSTHPEALAGIGASALPDDDGEPGELYFLRVSTSSRGLRRRQYLLDQMGNRLWASWDLEESVEALERSVYGRLHDDAGIWIDGLAVTGDEGAVLIHPALREVAIDATRSTTRTREGLFLPSVLFQLVSPNELEIPGSPPRRIPIKAILVPDASTRTTSIRQLLHLARRWDRPHLEAFAALSDSVPVHTLGGDVSLTDVGRRLLEAAGLDAPRP